MKCQFCDGVTMTFKPGGDSTKFIGSEGWVRISRSGIEAEPKSLLPANIAIASSPQAHVQNFIDSVKTRKPAVASIEDAVRSDTISHLCDIAVRTNRKITWDPQKKTIVGDCDAAKMMHREMRTPWTI
jgi:hypothetical protein